MWISVTQIFHQLNVPSNPFDPATILEKKNCTWWMQWPHTCNRKDIVTPWSSYFVFTIATLLACFKPHIHCSLQAGLTSMTSQNLWRFEMFLHKQLPFLKDSTHRAWQHCVAVSDWYVHTSSQKSTLRILAKHMWKQCVAFPLWVWSPFRPLVIH